MEGLIRISFDLWSALLAFGIFQGLLMMLILLGFKRNLALYSLIGLVLILVLNLFNYLLLSTNLSSELPHLVYVFTPSLFLIGPFYQWHIKASLDSYYQPKNIILHFLPFAFGVLMLSPFYSLTASEKIIAIEHQSQLALITTSSYAFIALQIVQTFAYMYATSKRMNISKRGRQGIKWLKKFGLAFSGYWFIDFVALTVYFILGRIHPQVFYITMLGAAIFINALVIFMIKNHKEFNLIVLNRWGKKYRNSNHSIDEATIVLNKASKIMEDEKPYLDSEFSLSKFALLLNKTPHQTSEILNSHMGKSFYEFINEYRFKEAKKRLQSDKYSHLTILAIAYDSGFNNKNTFNKVFKKYSGKTPSQFIKETKKMSL